MREGSLFFAFLGKVSLVAIIRAIYLGGMKEELTGKWGYFLKGRIQIAEDGRVRKKTCWLLVFSLPIVSAECSVFIFIHYSSGFIIELNDGKAYFSFLRLLFSLFVSLLPKKYFNISNINADDSIQLKLLRVPSERQRWTF